MIRLSRLPLPGLTGWLILTAATLAAQEASLQIDPTQTKIDFTLGDVLHTVHGVFQLKHGNLQFDPANGNASGELVVDARSGNSGTAARDRRMHKEILESERFPEIVFRPDRVVGRVAPQGASQVQLHGVFAIHGGDHEVTIPAEVEASGGQYSVVAHFDVPYVKWGMKNPSNFILRVNDRVQITVHTTARPAHELSHN